MIVIPIVYNIDKAGNRHTDYAAMEKEFRSEMNLLVDEELKYKVYRQDNDLNPGSRL